QQLLGLAVELIAGLAANDFRGRLERTDRLVGVDDEANRRTNRVFRHARPTAPRAEVSSHRRAGTWGKNLTCQWQSPPPHGTEFHGTHSGFSKLPPLQTLTRTRVRPPAFVGHDPTRRGGHNKEGWPIARGTRPKPTP